MGGRRKIKKDDNNYFLLYNHDGKVMIREYYYNVQNQGAICFDSSEQLHKVVNEIGLNTIKKYIFGVNE